MIGEQLPHLCRRLQVELVRVELEPVRIGEGRPGLDGEKHLVRARVVCVHVMQVVRCDQGQREVLRQPEQVGHDAALDAEPVVHDLGEVVVLAEEIAKVCRRLARLVVLAEPQAGLHLAARAPRRGDESGGVGLEQLAVHARLEVVPLHRRERRQPEQVVHPLRGLGEEGHVRVGAGPRHVVLAAAAPAHARLVAAVGAGCHVGLGADDRLDAGLGRLLPEIVGAEVVAVVGDRDRGHALLGHRLHEVPDPRRAVEHRVLAVHVQMHEGIARQLVSPEG